MSDLSLTKGQTQIRHRVIGCPEKGVGVFVHECSVASNHQITWSVWPGPEGRPGGRPGAPAVGETRSLQTRAVVRPSDKWISTRRVRPVLDETQSTYPTIKLDAYPRQPCVVRTVLLSVPPVRGSQVSVTLGQEAVARHSVLWWKERSQREKGGLEGWGLVERTSTYCVLMYRNPRLCPSAHYGGQENSTYVPLSPLSSQPFLRLRSLRLTPSPSFSSGRGPQESKLQKIRDRVCEE